MSLSSFVARVGVNPAFIAFQAHCWFAFSVVRTLGIYAALPMILVALAKEFWFDAKYEVPKQTFTDNLEDFLGYATGVVLATVLVVFSK